MSVKVRRGSETGQRGAALLIALVLLLVLTILGVTAMQSTNMQERMAGNLHARTVAFEAAEAALRDGEAYLDDFTVPPSPTGEQGFYSEADYGDGEDPQWEQVDWDDDDEVRTVSVDGTYNGARYIVEDIEAFQGTGNVFIPGEADQEQYMYRVTAVGTGVGPDATVMLQSTFKYGEE
ncbi:pilus assembly PilX family protein [Halofilum ochraceum]|uniref:pilus assembly PilX family protein n=1 Tax=Halofilum ochraceum TaxID=1611323 RepID=UPI0008D9C998|nr:PilX N-terminal domain-containing pilus assembly protein [Halofilum ochraceum]